MYPEDENVLLALGDYALQPDEYQAMVLGTCQMVKDNSHERRSAKCVGFGEAISNVTLEPKP